MPLDRRSGALLVLGLLVAAFTALSIAGTLANSDPGIHSLPIAITNLDRGASVRGRHINWGAVLVHRISGQASSRGVVAWSSVRSRARAVDGMDDDRYYAGLVIPADYSARIATLLNPKAAPHASATLEILTNPAAGLTASSAADGILLLATEAARESVMRQDLRALDRARIQVTPASAQYRLNPIQTVQTVVEPTPPHTGRGSAPFYMAIMVLVTAILGTAMLSQGVDAGAMAAAAQGKRPSQLQTWQHKLGLVAPFCALAGVLQTVIVIGILGVPASSWLTFMLLTVLGLLSIGMVTLFWNALAGPRGIVLTILFAIALGVPASGAIAPVQMLPSFFVWLHSWVPLRFLVDGYRAVILFHGRADAGLHAAVIALALIAFLCAVLTAGISVSRDRRRPGMRPGVPPELQHAATAR